MGDHVFFEKSKLLPVRSSGCSSKLPSGKRSPEQLWMTAMDNEVAMTFVDSDDEWGYLRNARCEIRFLYIISKTSEDLLTPTLVAQRSAPLSWSHDLVSQCGRPDRPLSQLPELDHHVGFDFVCCLFTGFVICVICSFTLYHFPNANSENDWVISRVQAFKSYSRVAIFENGLSIICLNPFSFRFFWFIA